MGRRGPGTPYCKGQWVGFSEDGGGSRDPRLGIKGNCCEEGAQEPRGTAPLERQLPLGAPPRPSAGWAVGQFSPMLRGRMGCQRWGASPRGQPDSPAPCSGLFQRNELPQSRLTSTGSPTSYQAPPPSLHPPGLSRHVCKDGNQALRVGGRPQRTPPGGEPRGQRKRSGLGARPWRAKGQTGAHWGEGLCVRVCLCTCAMSVSTRGSVLHTARVNTCVCASLRCACIRGRHGCVCARV